MESERSGDTIHGTVTGGVRDGQVAIGKGIRQSSARGEAAAVGPEELAELRRTIAELRTQVATAAPPELAAAALERVDELEAAVQQEKPDLATMEYVKGWFGRNLPKLAGAVSGVVVSPIVGRLVEAAGDAVVGEFRRRFGQ